MESRNTLVNVFIQHWIIPKVKFICKTIVANIIRLKPAPIYFVCHPKLVAIIPLETNCLLIYRHISTKLSHLWTPFSIHPIKLLILWLGLNLREGIINLGS